MRYPIVLFVALIAASLLFAEKPNLLLNNTDEHNSRTLGCHREQLPWEQALMSGETVLDTPHVDSIAHQGAIFTSMYGSQSRLHATVDKDGGRSHDDGVLMKRFQSHLNELLQE